MPTLRHAAVSDVPAMGRIINDAAEYGLMLHRSPAYLYEHIRDFHVAVDEQGEVVGVCGLLIIWGNLAEVYALAVRSDQRGKGLGGKLVQACVKEARQLRIRRLMALTYEQRFFEKQGFAVVDRQSLPLKVWTQCIRCAKNQACDEIAMVRVLEDVPDLVPQKPAAPPQGKLIVPTVAAERYAPGQPRPKMDEATWTGPDEK